MPYGNSLQLTILQGVANSVPATVESASRNEVFDCGVTATWRTLVHA